MIELRGVYFAYPGGSPVLNGVDLSLSAGERVAVVGPNGAGKSTLLGLLAGTLRPTGGRVLLDGDDVSSMRRPAIARRLAVVPQEIHVPFDFSVREMVSLGRSPHRDLFGRDPDGPAVVDAALGRLALQRLAERPYSELSGGERRRTLLALALAQRPTVLLLDEPTAQLDLSYQRDLLDELVAQSQADRLTVIAVLHDLSLAALYFPRVVLIAGGGVVADGAPSDVLTDANLTRALGPGIAVVEHPIWGVPQVVAVPRSELGRPLARPV